MIEPLFHDFNPLSIIIQNRHSVGMCTYIVCILI